MQIKRYSFIIAIFLFQNWCSGAVEKLKPPECTNRMFTIQINGIQEDSQTLRVRYRLGLSFTGNFATYNLIDYFTECFSQVLFRAISRTTFRATDSTYMIRSTDNLNGYLEHNITNLDALSVYDVYGGYQMKGSFNEQVYMTSGVGQTCFSRPDSPSDLRVIQYLNASYLMRWTEPASVYNSPSVCYYIVELSRGTDVQEREVLETEFYLSKEDTRTTVFVNVFSVYDIRCLTATFPFINNCANKLIKSFSGSYFRLDPAIDYISNASKFLPNWYFIAVVAAMNCIFS